MQQGVVVAGGGIGGLAAGVAALRAGRPATVLEQATAFGEVGAGLQFGPNATRVLRAWPRAWQVLQDRAARPGALVVRDAGRGTVLGTLQLGDSIERRHGAPYFTLHRADAHAALLEQARAEGADLRTGWRLSGVEATANGVAVTGESGTVLEAAALVGADGLWSRVREHLLHDGPPAFTGHLAYRAVLRQDDLPPALRSQDVTAWLAPRMHAVTYPVRSGDALNLVLLAEGPLPPDPQSWDGAATADAVRRLLAEAAPPLRDLAAAVPAWRLWALHARAPVPGAAAMARGRVALAGDAAHPMLPYLAQGAGMAVEDAAVLQDVLRGDDVPAALQSYAQRRWARCARVQARSLRNATIFHASGPMRWGRDAAMRLLGEPLLDLPWLYGGSA